MARHSRGSVVAHRRLRGLVPIALALALMGWAPGVPAYTYNENNTAATALFQMGGTARGSAMGGAYASLARGSEAAYWNPGGLAYQETNIELLFSPRIIQGEEFELGDDDRSCAGFQAGWRWRNLAIAGGYQHFGIGDILYSSGESSGGYGQNEVSLDQTFSNSQTGLTLAVGGLILQDHLGLGLSIRRLTNSFDGLPSSYENPGVETSGTGWTAQLGATYRANEDLSVAAVYDLPAEIDWGRVDADKSAARLQTGASWQFLTGSQFSLTVAAQLENVGREWVRVHTGGEVCVYQKLALRVGVRNLHLRSSTIATDVLNESTALALGLGTKDLKIGGTYCLGVDLCYDTQQFNKQIAATLRVGF